MPNTTNTTNTKLSKRKVAAATSTQLRISEIESRIQKLKSGIAIIKSKETLT